MADESLEPGPARARVRIAPPAGRAGRAPRAWRRSPSRGGSEHERGARRAGVAAGRGRCLRRVRRARRHPRRAHPGRCGAWTPRPRRTREARPTTSDLDSGDASLDGTSHEGSSRGGSGRRRCERAGRRRRGLRGPGRGRRRGQRGRGRRRGACAATWNTYVAACNSCGIMQCCGELATCEAVGMGPNRCAELVECVASYTGSPMSGERALRGRRGLHVVGDRERGGRALVHPDQLPGGLQPGPLKRPRRRGATFVLLGAAARRALDPVGPGDEPRAHDVHDGRPARREPPPSKAGRTGARAPAQGRRTRGERRVTRRCPATRAEVPAVGATGWSDPPPVRPGRKVASGRATAPPVPHGRRAVRRRARTDRATHRRRRAPRARRREARPRLLASPRMAPSAPSPRTPSRRRRRARRPRRRRRVALRIQDQPRSRSQTQRP